jgi:2-enoate reductase
MVDMAKLAKTVVKIPVIAVGKLGDPEIAESVLRNRNADFVALGRQLLADPEWPNKVRTGRLQDVRPCILDNEGCHRRLRDHKCVSCTVNPATGREKVLDILPAKTRKRIVVVGGGPAGMEAARVAAVRGHDVTILEGRGYLGGNLVTASGLDLKREYGDLARYLARQLQVLGVHVNLNYEATPESLEHFAPEVVIVATGAIPIIPDIDGVERSNVITAVDLLLTSGQARDPVVVIGGGLLGCEVALHVARKGASVSLVEQSENVLPNVFSVDRMHLLELMAQSGVKLTTNSDVLRITDEGVDLHSDKAQTTLHATTVVLAVGLKPNNKLLDSLSNDALRLYAIGDCVQPRRIINAMWEGFRVARLL